MNHNYEKKCVVCDTSYLIKHQIGYRSTEFFFECPTCGVMLSGEVKIDNENITIDSDFTNLVDANDETNAEYMIQLSGEFYDDKLSDTGGEFSLMLSPFMRTSSLLGPQNIQAFGGLTNYVLEGIPALYEDVSLVIDLIINNKDNKKYVFSELEKLSEDVKKFINYPKNQKEFLANYDEIVDSILFSSICYPFSILIEHNKDKFDLDLSRTKLSNLFKSNPEQVKKLSSLFQEDLPELINSIVNKINSYLSLIPQLTPLIVSETLGIYEIDKIKDEMGLNTVNYRDLLPNYADVYEILGKYTPILVAIENIDKRGNIDSYYNSKYKSFSEFNRKSIGEKIRYIEVSMDRGLDYMDFTLLNNRLRNSINHYSYSYDSLSQKLTFKDRNKKVEMFLLEFANDNYKMLYLMINALFVLCSLNSKFKVLDRT